MEKYREIFRQFRIPILILAFLIIVPFFIRAPFVLTILIMFFYYAYLGTCWNWIGGYTGQINLALGAFYGIGAYTTVVLFIELRLTPWVGMIIGAIFATILAYIIGKFSFRYKIKGFYFALVTMAVTETFRHLVSSFKITGATTGLYVPLDLSWYGFQFRAREPYYYVALALLIISVLITITLERRKIGYYLIAIREDEESAGTIGVDTRWYKTLALCLSAFFTSLAGAFSAQFFWYVDPESGFSLELVFYTILIVILGGRGTVWGPILGAAVLTVLSEGFRYIPVSSQEIAAISKIFYSSIIIAVIIFLKSGMVQLLRFEKEKI